jgi:predicted nucleic acid-binding protein
VKAASSSGCRILLTEDLQHRQTIDGVTVHNPFLAGGDVAEPALG